MFSTRMSVFGFICLFLTISILSCAEKKEVNRISIETSEGTELAFDISPDGQSIVFDLLGQIWILPAEGGEAVALTDSVREYAEHLHPTFSYDGKHIVFWESRPESWGLSSVDLEGRERRRITEVDSGTDIFPSSSPINGDIAFVRSQGLMILAGGDGEDVVELQINGLPGPGITDPAWSPDGRRLAFVNRNANRMSHRGGRLWQVGSGGGTAVPLTPEGSDVRAPAYSPDGRIIAYFLRNEDFKFELRVQELDGGATKRLVENGLITPVRLRWSANGDSLFYCAAGRIWNVPIEGGPPQEIPFTARLSFSQKRTELRPVQFPPARQIQTARGHMGFVLSPDGQKIAAIALNSLWAWRIGEEPEAVTRLPQTASGLCWSPDSTHVAWSAGYSGIEDLFTTNIQTGRTRRLTALPGTEVKASWSPDGRYIAFTYLEDSQNEPLRFSRNATLRVIDFSHAPVTELSDTLVLKEYQGPGQTNLLSVGFLTSSNIWGPDSKWLLGGNGGKPSLIFLDGKERVLKDSEMLQVGQRTYLWGSDGSLIYQKNYLLWRVPFDPERGITEAAVPISEDPALYPSTAQDGSVLYVSGDGWRLRRPNGEVKHLGWPISYETPGLSNSVVITNVRLIDGTGKGITPPSDILLEKGRIKKIGPSGKIRGNRESDVIDGKGRVVIPGLIDAHVHCWHHVLLPEYLYEGITTVRDMGSQLAWTKGYQESIEAGVKSGSRIVLGGLQLGPSLVTSVQGWNPDGKEGYERVLSMAEAFELDFIKMYWPINPYSGAKFVEAAHERGFPVSSHFGYPLPLVAAGIDSKEHLNNLMSSTGPRFGGALYDDLVQLSKAGRVSLVPTIDMSHRYVAADLEPSETLDAKSSSFVNDRTNSSIPRPRSTVVVRRSEPGCLVGSQNVRRFHEAGVPLTAGTDYPFYWLPWMLHRELEQYVHAGMSPLEAIVAATKNAARTLHAEKDIGTIEVGKLADLVILDANPIEDIRNTRKIWKVIQGGRVIDRDALIKFLISEAEEVANIDR